MQTMYVWNIIVVFRVYRRYLKVFPLAREDYIEYLKKIDKLDEAAQQLAILVNEDKPVSEKGKTGHQVIQTFYVFIHF